jgi:probable F420-dependent oxidoreductase
MKFGVCIPHYGRQLDADGLTEMAVKSEQMGFDSVWVTDHIIVPHVIPDRSDIVYRYNMLEPLTLLAHLGAVTKRVNIGTSVIILPYRNPVVLAKAIATADVLSNGRVIFGAAIGWMEGEFQALGAPFANRGQVSNEYLRLLKELWTNPKPTFQGEYFQFSEVTFSPMPVQQPHPPIWIGGRSRAGVRRAVEFGDFWHPSQMGPQEVAKMAAYLRRYSASVGRKTPPQLSVRGRALTFSNTVASGDRLPLQGTTEDIIADVQEYAEAGVSHLIMEIAGDTYADKFRAMERFMEEVKPRVPA